MQQEFTGIKTFLKVKGWIRRASGYSFLMLIRLCLRLYSSLRLFHWAALADWFSAQSDDKCQFTVRKRGNHCSRSHPCCQGLRRMICHHQCLCICFITAGSSCDCEGTLPRTQASTFMALWARKKESKIRFVQSVYHFWCAVLFCPHSPVIHIGLSLTRTLLTEMQWSLRKWVF